MSDLVDIFGPSASDSAQLAGIFGAPSFSDVTDGAGSTADDLRRKKRAELAAARAAQLGAPNAGLGAVPPQSVGDRVTALGDRAVTAAADGIASIPEMAAKGWNAYQRAVGGDVFQVQDEYPTLGTPGGFFDLKAQREDIHRQADAARERLLASDGDPGIIAGADTLAEGAGMAIPLPGLRAAKVAEELAPAAARETPLLSRIFGPPAAADSSKVLLDTAPEDAAFLANRAKAMQSIPGGEEPFVGPDAVGDAVAPHGAILQVGRQADDAAQRAALGLSGDASDPALAALRQRYEAPLVDGPPLAPPPASAPPSLAEIFGNARGGQNLATTEFPIPLRPQPPLDAALPSGIDLPERPSGLPLAIAEVPRAPFSPPIEAPRQDVFGNHGTGGDSLHLTPEPPQAGLLDPPSSSSKPPDAAPTLRNLLTHEEVPLDTPTTGTKNAVTDAERIARDLPAVEAIARKTSGETWGEARQLFEADPEAARHLAQRIAQAPRALTPIENDLLLHDRMKLTLDHRQALGAEDAALASGDTEGAAVAKIRRTSIEQAMDANDTAVKRSGTEWSAAGSARQKLIAEDYSPLYLRQRLTVAARESGAAELPGAADRLTEISQQLEAAHQQLATYEQRLSETQAAGKVRAVQGDVAAADRAGVRRAARQTLDAEYQDLAAQLEAKARKNQSTVNMSGGLDPETVGIIGRMARNRVQAGARGLGDVVDGIYQTIRPHIEGLEPSEVRDAISGYGVVRPQATRAEAAVELAKIRQQARLVAKLDALEAGEALPVARPRPARAPDTAALQEKLRQVTRDLDANPLRSDAQRLAATQKRFEARIADAERGLAAKAPRAPLAATPKTALLRQRLLEQLDHGGLIPDPSAARVAAAEASTARSLADLEKRLAAGDISPQGAKSSPWSAKLGAMRQEQAALQKRLADLRHPPAPPHIPVDPAVSRLNAYKRRLAVRETELTEQIAQEYFPKKARRPLALDSDAIALQGRVNALKQKADLIIRKQELAGRTGTEKAMDLTAGWGRFIKLTGTATLQKISSAAAERALVFRPIEEVLGAGWSKAPLVKHFAGAAPIEGGGSLNAIAKGYAGFFGKAARREMSANFAGTEGPMEMALAKPHLGGEVPEWMSYPGRVHAGLKAPAKISGYEYAIQKQAEHYLRLGQPEKLADPGVIAEMKAAAWEYAHREIFMGDNAAVRAINKALGDEAGQSTAAKAGKTVGRVLMPIVKVPTNYALEATDYLAGLPKAGLGIEKTLRTGRAALAKTPGADQNLAAVVKAGLEQLPSGQAERIMRQLKKGSLGAGLVALGATGVVKVGGYYDGPRPDSDLQPGQIEIAGHAVPHMILHHPALEALQVGGTIFRAHSLASGLGTAARGLAEQVPFIETPVSMARDLWGREPTKAVGSLERGLTIPPDAQRLARVLDQKGPPKTATEKTLQELGWIDIHAKKRKPHGSTLRKIALEEELGIPGLRDNVR